MATYTVSASTDDTDSGSNTTGTGGSGNIIASDLTNVLLSPGSHGANNYWYAGCRFTGIVAAQGATVTAGATFSLKAQATYASPGTVKLKISGQAADNPATFSTSAGASLSTADRPRTTASVTIDVSSVTGGTRYSADVTSILQELFNRAGWASGNAIVIIVEVDATTTLGEWQDFYSWDDATDRTNNPAQLTFTTGAAATGGTMTTNTGYWGP